jgi:hypothetical protein
VSTPTELLVVAGRGVRWVLLRPYGYSEYPSFQDAIKAARERLSAGYARAFVAIRIEAEIVDGILDMGGESRTDNNTDRELARFEVFPDRLILVPPTQGGLSDAQTAKVLALSALSGRLL